MAHTNDRTNVVSTQTSVVPAVPLPSAAPLSIEQQLALTLAALTESNSKIAGLMEQQAAYNKEALKIAPRRKRTMGEYLEERKKRGGGKRLLHDTWQNGRPVNPSGLSDATIKLLDTLATGKYCEGIVDVVRISDGINGINSRIHLMYNTRSLEDRMRFYMRFPSFTKLVTDIADDMKGQNIEPVHDVAADPVEDEFPEAL